MRSSVDESLALATITLFCPRHLLMNNCGCQRCCLRIPLIEKRDHNYCIVMDFGAYRKEKVKLELIDLDVNL